MARPVDPKAVKQRIKDNKSIMKETKAAVNEGMKKLAAGEEVDAGALRSALSMFIKASLAVVKDAALLVKAD